LNRSQQRRSGILFRIGFFREPLRNFRPDALAGNLRERDFTNGRVMLPTATVEHSMSGRLRVRVSALRGDVSYFRSAIEKLSAYPEIAGLRANPMTGSIVIEHETDLPWIRKIAAEDGVFDLQEASLPPPLPSPPGSNSVIRTGRPAAMEGGSKAAAIGLIGLGAYRATRGDLFGPATENFWNAFGALRILNNPWIALVFGSLGFLQLTRGRWAGSASSLLFYALVVTQMSSSNFGARPRPLSHADRTEATGASGKFGTRHSAV
jgi:hypothetical protein